MRPNVHRYIIARLLADQYATSATHPPRCGKTDDASSRRPGDLKTRPDKPAP